MPLRFEIKKKLSARSERVKSVDIHPTEPWILSSLYNGNVYIWNYQTQALVKSFEVCEPPVRVAKFVTRKQWVLTGSDDMQIRVYNYNTMEKLKTFEAHTDYIRALAVHPTQPYVLSSSDDMTIKLWDWDKNWSNIQLFEGHTHYVMQLVFNPKDTNTFASASLDRTIKVWSLGSTTPNFTLEGHEKGVNCVDYYIGGDKPYLISGADDKLVKIWDYQNKTCVQTLEGHSHNVSVVAFHPEVPVIITGSEDGTVRVWHLNTYRLEKTLNYGLERVWAIGHLRGSNYLALGYDEGTVMLKLGREEPAISMDQNGKVIWAKHNEIQTGTIRAASESEVADGERVTLATKDLGNCEIYPQTLQHTPNGRFVVVCGDGEYIIYTALAWRNKAFGQGLEFVWGTDTGEYAVRESTSKVKLYKNFKETKTLRPNFSAEGIFGGPLLGVRSREFIALYDWEECRLIRRIDVCPKQIYWSDNSEMVAICCESAFYILKYSKEEVAQHLAQNSDTGDEGIESAFEVLHEISERVRTAIWVGDCFIYTNNNNRLNYCVGSEIVTISHLDRHMYLLGYIPRDNRIYLTDKSLNLVSYQLHLTIINYQTAVLRGDLETAARILPEIPTEQRTRIAHFLESQGYKEEALQTSMDPDHKFELAVQLEKLEMATDLARESPSEAKWKQLSDLALNAAKFDLAEQSFKEADDLGGLLLLYTSTCDAAGLEKLAQLSLQVGKHNIAFVCYFMLRRLNDCLDLLVETGRIPEAAFLARTYVPSQVPRIVKLWKEDLKSINERAAESLADPIEFPNLFPDLKFALQAEKFLEKSAGSQPASAYMKSRDDLGRDIISEVKGMNLPEISFDTAAAPAPNGVAPESPTVPKAVAPASPVVPKAAPTVPMSPVLSPVATPVATTPAPSSPVVPRAAPAPAPTTPIAAPAPAPTTPVTAPAPVALTPTKTSAPTPAPTPVAKVSAMDIPLLDEDEDLDDALARELESELNE